MRRGNYSNEQSWYQEMSDLELIADYEENQDHYYLDDTEAFNEYSEARSRRYKGDTPSTTEIWV